MDKQKITSLTILPIAMIVLLFAARVLATEEFARMTGTECRSCHIDPLGGGELTELGKGYLLSVKPEATTGTASRGIVSRGIHLIFRYLHIVTAFLWFGTILYVHLVLKPAYASSGLPRGEVRVGLFSMAIMAVTGLVLMYFKVPSFSISMLVSSKYGILLLVKIILFSLMVLSALYVVLFIGPRLKKKKAVQKKQFEELTLSELVNFDGQEGRPAYFAFKGKIYDASQSRLWPNGTHMARHKAGIDLTDVLSQAPHDEEKIIALPEIGKLAQKTNSLEKGPPQRIFFFMAYLNLVFVFLITFILALWRWS